MGSVSLSSYSPNESVLKSFNCMLYVRICSVLFTDSFVSLFFFFFFLLLPALRVERTAWSDIERGERETERE